MAAPREGAGEEPEGDLRSVLVTSVLNLEPLDLDLFRGRHYWVPVTQRLFGGQIVGQALVAAAKAVSEEAQPHQGEWAPLRLLGWMPELGVGKDMQQKLQGALWHFCDLPVAFGIYASVDSSPLSQVPIIGRSSKSEGCLRSTVRTLLCLLSFPGRGSKCVVHPHILPASRGPHGARSLPGGANPHWPELLSAVGQGHPAWEAHPHLPGLLPAGAGQPRGAPVPHAGRAPPGGTADHGGAHPQVPTGPQPPGEVPPGAQQDAGTRSSY
ncbi:hypothetical protein JRQ81_014470 [Phrynocephalus forsythii]|uniref:Uncharacterized protein n=1 Tax=Phrynocephalus forsythii TaxID=171643 RepID=A0A9Q0XYQ1_9SAUR|nr:hypothetical protein JRQ81_014470 [Phrynocephalus forsythii]